MAIHFDKKIFPNGLRLITAPMHETKAVTILILVGAGSRYEDARTNGVAHFLEHMFFKGTTNRPTTLEISKELDALGAEYNAFTGEEYTGFYVRVAAPDFAQAFDIITDMLLNPLFLADEIEREKGVIVEELNMYQDSPMRAIHDSAKELMYGDTPLGRNIGGRKQTVTKFDRDDFIAFRKKYYQPDNLVLAIAGAGDESIWKKMATDRLGALSGQAAQSFDRAKTQQTTPRVRLDHKATDQAHILLSFHGLSREDKRRPALKVLQNILGGTMSSRLFIEVRERRGLAYYVSAGSWDFRDAGALIGRAGVQVDKIDEAIKVIFDEFRRMRDVPVSAEELDRAKKNLRGGLYLSLEDSESIADYVAEQELFHEKVEQPEDKIAKIEEVTAEDIQTLARDLIQRGALNLTVIGPYKDQKRFTDLVEQF